MRNLDVSTLRSFVAVAESGGVTRAAGFLHLTQSAVSMQLKRLEQVLDLELLDRSGRGIALTASGEQLLTYARQMVALNDEVMTKLTDQDYEGEINLGVPNDIVYPVIPRVLKQFNAVFPRMKVQLMTSYTRALHADFAKGNCDLILTTESELQPGGETLSAKSLIWIGAPGGSAWRQRPLRLAFCRQCIFRPLVVRQLDRAGIPWDLILDTDSDRTIEATVSADLAVCAAVEGTEPPQLERIDHGHSLPELPPQNINLYGSGAEKDVVRSTLADLLRRGFSSA